MSVLSINRSEYFERRAICQLHVVSIFPRASPHSLPPPPHTPNLSYSLLFLFHRPAYFQYPLGSELLHNYWEKGATTECEGFPGGSVVNNPPAMQETWVRSLGPEDPRVGRIPWRRKWQPTLVFLPGKCHGQRSLWATVHGAAKSLTPTWLSNWTIPTVCDWLGSASY